MSNSSFENVTIALGKAWVRYTILTFMDTVFLTLYAMILAILLRNSKLKFSTSYYVLVTGLGFADLFILVSLYFFYAFDVWQFDNKTKLVINFVSNSMGYFPSLYLNALIAVNRFFAIVTFNRFPELFARGRCVQLIACAFFAGLVAMSVYQFLPTGHYAFYGSVIATLCVISASYAACIVACFIQLSAQALSTNQRRQYHTEMKFMFQAMTLASVIVVEESSYHLTNGGLIYQILYMVYGGVAPIVHFVTNSEIRNIVKNFIGRHLLRRSDVSQVTVIRLTSNNMRRF